MDPRVLEKMLPWFTEKFGNESSNTHSFGWEAKEAIDIAREEIATHINALPSEIIFTSGATESINIALRGVINFSSNSNSHIIVLNTEHKAVLDTCEFLEKNGVEISYLNVKSNGIVDLNEIENSIKHNTVLISILHGNNEIGVLQPIEEIGLICKERNILFHVDGAQTLGKLALDMQKMNIDLFSMSSHKIYGPKGVGALYIRRKNPRVQLVPILTGGGQEKGIRPGTLPVPLIVGFAEAVILAYKDLAKDQNKITHLKNRFLEGLNAKTIDFKINGDLNNRLQNNLNISFLNIKGESLIMRLSKIAVSTGSACTSSTLKPSHVLKSLGLSDNLAFSTIRVGFGRFNTENDIDTAIELLSNVLNKLKLKKESHATIN